VVFDHSLNLVDENVLDKETRAHMYLTWGKPALDENTLYVTGWSKTRNEERIIVYAIQTAPKPSALAVATYRVP